VISEAVIRATQSERFVVESHGFVEKVEADAIAPVALAFLGVKAVISASVIFIVIQTAETRGIYSCGYHASQAAIAPKGYLTGAEWDWSHVYGMYVKEIQEGKSLQAGSIPHVIRGGLEDGFVKVSDYGPAVSEQAKQAAEAGKAKFMNGTMVIYKGEIKDNTGKVVIPAGVEMNCARRLPA
jgi:basic membrane lipoprotein Med (substrate-binding protein (PBP1-ABC) superfamily)